VVIISMLSTAFWLYSLSTTHFHGKVGAKNQNVEEGLVVARNGLILGLSTPVSVVLQFFTSSSPQREADLR